MAAGSPDLVDCMHLAEDAAALQRQYDLAGLPRLQDVLAEPVGRLQASFAFAKAASGRAAARVGISARTKLRCQRCLGGFDFELTGGSEIEFADSDEAAAQAPDREFYLAERGLVSLRELAEEEFLLALPLAAACSDPDGCGQGARSPDRAVRPFSALRDLLKKT